MIEGDKIDDVDHFMLTGGKPLGQERYPRVFPKREVTGGFFVALGLVLAVWIITPLSW